jgi:predicted nucleic acid-binding protein
VALAWCFPEESNTGAEKLLDSLAGGSRAIIPSLWPFEVANALLTAERRKRVSMAQVTAILKKLALLPIAVDAVQVESVFGDVLAVARQGQLTEYDAAYLELALRESLPLATLDDQLRRAARNAGVRLVAI